MEDSLNESWPQWKTTSMEDDLNGRWPQWKTTLIENNLNGRWPQWKMTSIEDDLNWRWPQYYMNWMEDDFNGRRPQLILMSNMPRWTIFTCKTIKLKTVGASMEDNFNRTQPQWKNLLAKLELSLAQLSPSLYSYLLDFNCYYFYFFSVLAFPDHLMG